jgi:hypothetical protein
MFWNAVFKSFGIFIHWQVYLVTILYLMITFLPFVFLYLVSRKSEGGIAKTGCLIMFVQPFFQVFGVFFAVSTLLPVLLGRNTVTWALPWTLIIHEPFKIILLMFVMVILSILGSFIPLIGQTNSLSTFTSGWSVLLFLFREIDNFQPEYGIGKIDLFPGVGTFWGIVIISAIVSWLCRFLIAALATTFFRKNDDNVVFFLMPITSVFGFFPIFIYASWISLQLSPS